MNNTNYFAVIPANVRYDKEISDKAKLIYGEITALANEKGYCWASNNYFAELYGVKKETISRIISQLEKRGYVKTVLIYKKNSKEIQERRIYIQVPIPIEENVNTGIDENDNRGIDKNINTPIDENVKENNTVINNIISNSNKEQIACQLKEIVKIFNENIHPITPIEFEKLVAYIDQDKMDHRLIIRAIEIAVCNGSRYLSYIEGILKKWRDRNLLTVEAVEAYIRDYQDRKNQNNNQIREEGGSGLNGDSRSNSEENNPYAKVKKLKLGGR